MVGVIKFLFNKVPGHWWRKGIKSILVPAFSFYLVSIAGDVPFIEKYRLLFVQSKFWYFIIIQILVTLFFYVLVDFLLRLLAFKVIKKKVMRVRSELSVIERREMLRDFSDFKNAMISFLMGYPIELGYINRSDFKEIETIEPIVVSPEEKEKAINEVITAINKWACVLIHLVFTLLIVWHYDKVLMIIIMLLGFLLTIFIYFAVMLIITNVEILNTVFKHLKRIR